MEMVARYGGTCARCRCRFAVGARIDWERGRGATHATNSDCQEAIRLAGEQAAARPHVVSGAHKPIADFLAAARERGLRFPTARFLAPDGRGEMRLWVAGPNARVPGAVSVSINDEWFGRIAPDGTVSGRRLEGAMDVLALLSLIARDPAAAARAYGALTSHCSFCGKPLTDEGSVEVGYGKWCAQKFGLPHRARGSRKLTEVVSCQPSEGSASTADGQRGVQNTRRGANGAHESAA